jgi:hypothetical protein
MRSHLAAANAATSAGGRVPRGAAGLEVAVLEHARVGSAMLAIAIET